MMQRTEPGRLAHAVSERREPLGALAEHMPLGVNIWRLEAPDDLAECRWRSGGER